MTRSALSIAEACEAANLSHMTIYKAINSGALRAVKAGRRTLILAADFNAWLANMPSYSSPSAHPKRRNATARVAA